MNSIHDNNKFLLIIKKIADYNLSNEILIDNNRSIMPSGHNGSYFDIETPVRNTSHWLITYSKLYLETKDDKYFKLANKLANFLLNPDMFRENGVYIHRQKSGKDWCNGVVGQGWVIEALNTASKILKRPELKELAIKSAKAFDFDNKIKAWYATNPQNGKKKIDYTLNHQIWFAAVIYELDDCELNRQVKAFLDSLNNGAFKVRNDGVIAHLFYKNTLKGILLQIRYKLSEFRMSKKVREKEVGYHLFNLHPLARIYKINSTHTFFELTSFKKALKIISEQSFQQELEESKYSYPYNAPAFEYPLICKTFGIKMNNGIFGIQLEKTFFHDDNIQAFYNNCPDKLTLNARIYEYFIK